MTGFDLSEEYRDVLDDGERDGETTITGINDGDRVLVAGVLGRHAVSMAAAGKTDYASRLVGVANQIAGDASEETDERLREVNAIAAAVGGP